MGGLPSFTINSDLATVWRRVLEQNGVSASRVSVETNEFNLRDTVSRVSEVVWRIGVEEAHLEILEVVFLDRQDGHVHLVSKPLMTIAERKLFQRIQRILSTNS